MAILQLSALLLFDLGGSRTLLPGPLHHSGSLIGSLRVLADTGIDDATCRYSWTHRFFGRTPGWPVPRGLRMIMFEGYLITPRRTGVVFPRTYSPPNRTLGYQGPRFTPPVASVRSGEGAPRVTCM